MRVFGLELKQPYAELFIAAVSVNGSDALTRALADCTETDIQFLERSLNEYYRRNEFLRERGASNQRMETSAIILAAASAPVVTLLMPSLSMQRLDIPAAILLAQFSYPDRKFGFDLSAARGYMAERLLTEGNVWEKPLEEYIWLGENYRLVASVAPELIKRKSLDQGLIMELSRMEPALLGGSL
jgi:hypothetical protein